MASQPEAKVKLQPLDTSKADVQTWLVKVPGYVYDAWVTQPRGTVLGSLTVNPDGVDNKVEVKLHTDEEIPKDYALEPLQLSEEIVVFSEDADRELMIEGKISKRVDMRATDDVAVRAAMAAKTKQMKLQHDQREQEAIQEIDMLKKKQPLAFKNTLVGEKRTRDHRGVAELRERIDKEKLLGKIFECFAEKDVWGFTEINDRLKQPVVWLKEVIMEVCIHNKAGPNKGKYELRPEFNTNKRRKVDDSVENGEGATKDAMDIS